MGVTYKTQSVHGSYRIRPKIAETLAWKKFEYDLLHVMESVLSIDEPIEVVTGQDSDGKMIVLSIADTAGIKTLIQLKG